MYDVACRGDGGAIEYLDSGGSGPSVVLLHGLAMDGTVWEEVVGDLSPDYRCIRPTLPFGSHRRPMRPDADLSLRGIGAIVSEFLERLALNDVTLCFNDWSGAQVMIADGLMQRVGRLVLTPSEAFDNYPPGLPGRAVTLSSRLPGGLLLVRAVLLSPLRRLPLVYGQMSKRGVSVEQLRSWLEPLRRPEIRRDLAKYFGDTRRGRRDMLAATASLPSFSKPVLIAWNRDGKMMPPDHGRRLAQAFPDSRLVELPDCYTLMPIDQPAALVVHPGNPLIHASRTFPV